MVPFMPRSKKLGHWRKDNRERPVSGALNRAPF
jgi:hypothetical protein